MGAEDLLALQETIGLLLQAITLSSDQVSWVSLPEGSSNYANTYILNK
jgi:hypothetical protein